MILKSVFYNKTRKVENFYKYMCILAKLLQSKIVKINLKTFPQEQNNIQNEKHGPYIEVSAIPASTVTLT